MVKIDGHRFFNQSINADLPRMNFERLRGIGNLFMGAEFIKIIVGDRVFLRCQGPVELVAAIALGWIKISRARRGSQCRRASRDR